MGATRVEKRRIARTEDIVTLAKSIADQSTDPDATYEGFLLGLEIGLSCGPLDEDLGQSLGIGEDRIVDVPRTRVIADPRKPMIRKVPTVRYMPSSEFPTEWTMDQ